MDPCARVSTDAHSGYAQVLPGLGVASHDAVPASEAVGRLGMAGALHRRPRRSLDRFAGVSTRRLAHYLASFEWAEQIRRSGSRPARVMSDHASVPAATLATSSTASSVSPNVMPCA